MLHQQGSIREQIGKLLEENGLRLLETEIIVTELGEPEKIYVCAEYADGPETEPGIWVPTVAPVNPKQDREKNVLSPMELYIRELLAEFYRVEENTIEVVIREAG